MSCFIVFVEGSDSDDEDDQQRKTLRSRTAKETEPTTSKHQSQSARKSSSDSDSGMKKNQNLLIKIKNQVQFQVQAMMTIRKTLNTCTDCYVLPNNSQMVYIQKISVQKRAYLNTSFMEVITIIKQNSFPVVNQW